MTTHSQMDRALAALYDRIPRIPDCSGQCWISCGPIDMSDRERQRIRQRGIRISDMSEARRLPETYYCEALTEDKRCAVYELRPLVCRLWGAVEGLKCPYGCIPEGGWLSNDEAYKMIVESGRIGGHEYAVPDTAEVRAVLDSEWFKNTMARDLSTGKHGDALRTEDAIPPAFRKRQQ